jgi:hypothetical protein
MDRKAIGSFAIAPMWSVCSRTQQVNPFIRRRHTAFAAVVTSDCSYRSFSVSGAWGNPQACGRFYGCNQRFQAVLLTYFSFFFIKANATRASLRDKITSASVVALPLFR